jgi:hypothetical protein
MYMLLAGASGTHPGTVLPSGVEMPLNFDNLTTLVMANLNNFVFQNFLGNLDASGEAVATFSTNGLTPFNPHMAGTKLYFSAVIGKKFEFATNARILTFVN